VFDLSVTGSLHAQVGRACEQQERSEDDR